MPSEQSDEATLEQIAREYLPGYDCRVEHNNGRPGYWFAYTAPNGERRHKYLGFNIDKINRFMLIFADLYQHAQEQQEISK